MTNLLLQNLKNTAQASHKEGRIVNVSSLGHRFTYREGIRFDKINDKDRYFMGAIFIYLLIFNVYLSCYIYTLFSGSGSRFFLCIRGLTVLFICVFPVTLQYLLMDSQSLLISYTLTNLQGISRYTIIF